MALETGRTGFLIWWTTILQLRLDGSRLGSRELKWCHVYLSVKTDSQILRRAVAGYPARIRGTYRDMNWLRVCIGKLEGVQELF